MSENRLLGYIEHMLQAGTDASNFVHGLDKEAFLADKRTQQAVIMNLVIIGEAATKVVEKYTSFAEAHPEIPWKNMRGMRNRITHGYFDINLEIVWDTVQKALPELLTQLVDVRNGMEDDGTDSL